LIAGILASQTAPAMVATHEPPAAPEPIVACESAPAEDTGDVQIGTALRLYRGADAENVDCDGTLTTL
jgi:hypothetical protein